MEKIKNFTDLNSWKKGHELLLEIYQLSAGFPSSELFGLTSQMRRAALSVTSNLAEGFGRSSTKEKLQFYNIALGSLTELQNQIIASKDLKLITQKEFDSAWEKTIVVQKLTNGLVRSIRFPS